MRNPKLLLRNNIISVAAVTCQWAPVSDTGGIHCSPKETLDLPIFHGNPEFLTLTKGHIDFVKSIKYSAVYTPLLKKDNLGKFVFLLAKSVNKI